ncbi:MAG: pyridoxamine 5'-phosphate oxidase family protein [Zoogloea sp.]|jgi:nitroimidazol reductase NimA-like FMN-containing flavoprotein (pyridoxamine 5'-phosphate oxidase superfamily)|nr:pyridoxamine 5'-phosphate oxidase family protein [Zoogloea sp.]
MSQQSPSPRTEVRRKPQRAHHDPATIRAIIDQALVCQIAFNQGGSVHCLPTACWRDGDFLYIHGANNSRLTQTLLEDECAVSITHLDGLVLARSAFHHSMNYRSVVIYGRFEAEDDPDAKAAAFKAFVEHASPGRSAQVRPPSRAELAGTRLLRIALDEAVAKIRNWGVEDSVEDMAIPVWAGVLPLSLRAGPVQPEAGCAEREPPTPPAFIGFFTRCNG